MQMIEDQCKTYMYQIKENYINFQKEKLQKLAEQQQSAGNSPLRSPIRSSIRRSRSMIFSMPDSSVALLELSECYWRHKYYRWQDLFGKFREDCREMGNMNSKLFMPLLFVVPTFEELNKFVINLFDRRGINFDQ